MGAKARSASSSNGGDRDLSRADQAYNKLREGIRSGEFHLGQRLREAELADRFKISRTPVREAIRRLAADGLVQIAPWRGMMIIDLEKQQVRELYALRATLEGAAARMAAQHASPGELKTMRDLLAPAADERDPAELARINQHFHQAIHDAAHNRYLARALTHLSDSLTLLPGTTYEISGRPEEALKEHRAILAAIQARQADKAETLARRHIEKAEQIRIRMMFDLS